MALAIVVQGVICTTHVQKLVYHVSTPIFVVIHIVNIGRKIVVIICQDRIAHFYKHICTQVDSVQAVNIIFPVCLLVVYCLLEYLGLHQQQLGQHRPVQHRPVQRQQQVLQQVLQLQQQLRQRQHRLRHLQLLQQKHLQQQQLLLVHVKVRRRLARLQLYLVQQQLSQYPL